METKAENSGLAMQRSAVGFLWTTQSDHFHNRIVISIGSVWASSTGPTNAARAVATLEISQASFESLSGDPKRIFLAPRAQENGAKTD